MDAGRSSQLSRDEMARESSRGTFRPGSWRRRAPDVIWLGLFALLSGVHKAVPCAPARFIEGLFSIGWRSFFVLSSTLTLFLFLRGGGGGCFFRPRSFSPNREHSTFVRPEKGKKTKKNKRKPLLLPRDSTVTAEPTFHLRRHEERSLDYRFASYKYVTEHLEEC